LERTFEVNVCQLQDVGQPITLDIRAIDTDNPILLVGCVVDLAAQASQLMMQGCMFAAEDLKNARYWGVETIIINRHTSTANLDALGCFSQISRLELNGVVSSPLEGAASLSRALRAMQCLLELVINDHEVSGPECAHICQAVSERVTLRTVHMSLGHAAPATRVRCMWVLSALPLTEVLLRFES
jgi:hypothetical protein